MNETETPLAWMRKWAFEKEITAKIKNENNRLVWPRKYKFVPVSASRIFPDDVPLFAKPSPHKPLNTKV